MSQVVCLNLSLFHSGTYLQAGNAKPINAFKNFMSSQNIFKKQ